MRWTPIWSAAKLRTEVTTLGLVLAIFTSGLAPVTVKLGLIPVTELGLISVTELGLILVKIKLDLAIKFELILELRIELSPRLQTGHETLKEGTLTPRVAVLHLKYMYVHA